MKSAAVLCVQPKQLFASFPRRKRALSWGLALCKLSALSLLALSLCTGCDGNSPQKKEKAPPTQAAPPPAPPKPQLPFFVGEWRAEIEMVAPESEQGEDSDEKKPQPESPAPELSASTLSLTLKIDEEKHVTGSASWAGKELQTTGVLLDDALRARLRGPQVFGSFVLHKEGESYVGRLSLAETIAEDSGVTQSPSSGSVRLEKLKK